MGTLKGKRAFITGGSRGIGAAIARRLAMDGADIALTFERSTEAAQALTKEIRGLERRAISFRADSRDPAALKDAIDEAAGTLGGIDILANNAGAFNIHDFEPITLADIDTVLAGNRPGLGVLRHP